MRDLINEKIDFTSLTKIILGGNKIDTNLIEAGRNLGLKIHTSYGMTETWGGVCIDGNFLNNTKGRIVDGQLEIKSGSMMSGFRHDNRKTLERFSSDGWFKTGDLGSITENRLSISGRADDQIISGGIKVDPDSVARLIAGQYQELDFAICATPHLELGSAVTLCVQESQISTVSLSGVRKRLLQFLPSTQLPTRLASVDQIPKTDSGKIRRQLLSERCQIVSDHFQGESHAK